VSVAAGTAVGAVALAVSVFYALSVVVLVPTWPTQKAIASGFLPLEVAVVTLVMAPTVAGVWWALFQGGVARRLHLGRVEPSVRALLLLVFATASFASLTGVLYAEGAIDVGGSAIAAEDAVDRALDFYLWQIADSVPLLDVTSNLDWDAPFKFEDRLGGLLLVLFKGFVIVPLVQIARLILGGGLDPYEEAVLRALRTASKERRLASEGTPNLWLAVRRRVEKAPVSRTKGDFGYDRAVVEEPNRVLVDVMRNVSTEDAVLSRLALVDQLHAQHGTTGYLLVVDAIGERARDRIEKRFAETTFPAQLAVWRGDQPTEDLGRTLDRLHAAIERGRRD
jgi:hypothetical protein